MSGKATNSGEATEKPQSVLILPEHAACAGENCSPDEFNLEAKLGRLLRALRAKSTQPPLAVALTGDWGTGKSSAMHWLKAELKRKPTPGQPGFKTCTFKPWKYQTREAVLGGLLAAVIASVCPPRHWLRSVLAFLLAFIDGVLTFFRSLKSMFGLEVGTQGGIVQAARFAHYTYNNLTKPESIYSDSFERALREALKKYLGEANRLVIFIDDLDRCLPEVAIQVLEAMKLFFDQAQVIFILGVDRDVVDRMMVRHYTEALKPTSSQEQAHVARKARQYLDKMFQIEVQVPPTDKQVREFAEKQVARIQGWDKLTEDHQKKLVIAVRAVAGINPRGVIRALNSAFIGAGSVLDQIDAKLRALNEAKSHKGDQQLTEQELVEELESLGVSLAQAVQLRLVEAVLAGSEVAALAATTSLDAHEIADSENFRVEDWHALARHAQGREFLRAWSCAVQGDGAQYLRPDQIQWALSSADLTSESVGIESRRDDPDEEVPKQDSQLIKKVSERGELERESMPIPSRLVPLFEIARKFPAMSPLLSVSALGVVLTVAEFADDRYQDTVDDAEADLRRLAEAIARHRQVDAGTINLDDLRQSTSLDLSKSDLDLSNSDLTDEEARGLRFLSHLQHLSLTGTRVSDITPLSECKSLVHVNLDGTQVSDITPLAECKGLESLHLSGTQVSDISPLAECMSLESLYLSLTQVSDVSPLAECKSLALVNLYGTKVSDISPLKDCIRLSTVVLPNGKVWDPTDDPPPQSGGVTGVR